MRCVRCRRIAAQLPARPATHRTHGLVVLEGAVFEAAYRKVGKLGVGEGSSYFSRVYELPDGTVHLSVRDPAGNLVEINWPDVTTLERSVVAHVEGSQADRTPGSTCGLHRDA